MPLAVLLAVSLTNAKSRADGILRVSLAVSLAVPLAVTCAVSLMRTRTSAACGRPARSVRGAAGGYGLLCAVASGRPCSSSSFWPLGARCALRPSAAFFAGRSAARGAGGCAAFRPRPFSAFESPRAAARPAKPPNSRGAQLCAVASSPPSPPPCAQPLGARSNPPSIPRLCAVASSPPPTPPCAQPLGARVRNRG